MAIEEAEERIEALRREIEALEGELKEKAAGITKRWDVTGEDLESVSIRPRRNDVEVDTVAIAWEPYWLIDYSDVNGTNQKRSVGAFRR